MVVKRGDKTLNKKEGIELKMGPGREFSHLI